MPASKASIPASKAALTRTCMPQIGARSEAGCKEDDTPSNISIITKYIVSGSPTDMWRGLSKDVEGPGEWCSRTTTRSGGGRTKAH